MVYVFRQKNQERNKEKQKRVLGYEVKQPGDLFQLDTIVRFEQGIKRYIITAIDVVFKFAFAYCYKSKSSKSTIDFFEKLIKVTPYSIKAIQTDNGSGFLGLFDKEINKQGIPHFFIYPRCPKQNGVIERLNRTLQEEWLEAKGFIRRQRLKTS
ncbi:MAG: DDE-type integrase/transposase/recombinase [Candidatus Heimdallarchaeota archaeon]